jgi:hypothetical protein
MTFDGMSVCIIEGEYNDPQFRERKNIGNGLVIIVIIITSIISIVIIIIIVVVCWFYCYMI